jgi:hypothetical protein
MRKIRISANWLKILAAVAMVTDHTVALFLPHGSVLRLILRIFGRLAAPAMCFLIAEGYHYTSHCRKYLLRLLIFALISHLPYNLAMGFGLSPLAATSAIWALAMGLIALMAVKNEKLPWILRLGVVGLCCLLAYSANWNYIAVLWIVAFGIFHGQRKKQLLAFALIGAVLHLTQQFLPLLLGNVSAEDFRQWHQLGIFLAIPVLAAYDGSRRCKSKLFSWCFYILYPAHLLILYLLTLVF